MSNAFFIVCGIILILTGGGAWLIGNFESDRPLYFNWVCGGIVLMGLAIIAYTTGKVE